MKKYELLLVLPGTLDDKEAETRSIEVLNLVKEHGSDAEITSMGKTRLAYPIKQIRYGYFYTIVFSAATEMVKNLQAKLALTRDLLRAIVSEFNAPYVPTQKLNYITNEIGVTTISAQNEEKVDEKKTGGKVSIQEIDKKLDELLNSDIIQGV